MQLSKNPRRELNLGGVQLIKLVLALTITVALPLSFLSLTEAGAADVETKNDGKDNKSESKSEIRFHPANRTSSAKQSSIGSSKDSSRIPSRSSKVVRRSR